MLTDYSSSLGSERQEVWKLQKLQRISKEEGGRDFESKTVTELYRWVSLATPQAFRSPYCLPRAASPSSGRWHPRERPLATSQPVLHVHPEGEGRGAHGRRLT
ncbi:hypothetical protein BaRGS_00001681 [Batillaria attramentaria]|uniref:Uncharacterized protein n=1 Tax=Batillaria attramentaria TaxID=370345 RepID=A0ABD0M573_9CAEN